MAVTQTEKADNDDWAKHVFYIKKRISEVDNPVFFFPTVKK